MLATKNGNKVREIEAHLAGLNLSFLSLNDRKDLAPIEEDGETFQENAIKKATIVAKASRILTLADDSGLIVVALHGAPGILSARYAGVEAGDQNNNEKLLSELKSSPSPERRARFICAVALATPEKLLGVVEGSCEGEIIDEPRGTKGFGYDPLFIKVGYGKTFAELDMDVKNRISHRATALDKAKLLIEDYLIKKAQEH